MRTNRLGKAKKEELDRIARSNGGLLLPEAVVASAQKKSSALHNDFDWSDTEAAKKWRLHQARHIINVYVTVMDAPGPKEIRAYVSLTTDRSAGGGYRSMRSVMSSPKLRAQLLEDAFDDFNIFKTKYAILKELAGVFEAIERARRKCGK